MRFKRHDIVFEVRDTAHIAAFRAAGWQELAEPKTDIENPEAKPEGNVENSVETVKSAKPKRAKA